jgi:hypothetical protein
MKHPTFYEKCTELAENILYDYYIKIIKKDNNNFRFNELIPKTCHIDRLINKFAQKISNAILFKHISIYDIMSNLQYYEISKISGVSNKRAYMKFISDNYQHYNDNYCRYSIGYFDNMISKKVEKLVEYIYNFINYIINFEFRLCDISSENVIKLTAELFLFYNKNIKNISIKIVLILRKCSKIPDDMIKHIIDYL